MSKLDEIPLEGRVEENSTEQAEEKPFDAEEFLTSRRSDYEERANGIAEEKRIDMEGLIRADAIGENITRRHLLDMDILEKEARSDLIYENLDNGNTLLKGNIDGKNYEIEADTRATSFLGGSVVEEIIRSSVDGDPLDTEKAKNIFYKFQPIASSRSHIIENLKDYRDKNNE